ncbi:MAG: adenosine deaminase [Paracoccaceae bacterium]
MNTFTTTPKTELHLHLEGAAPPAFIRQLAHEKKVDLEGIFGADGTYKWTDFVNFLRVYEAACSVLQSPEDFARLTEAVLAESAAHGVIYTEIFLAPDFCGGDVIKWREYLAAICEAASSQEAKLGITTRFISTVVRHFGAENARKTARISAETASPMLTGFGMGGDENFGKAGDFAWAFACAAEAGLGLTSHAGEVRGAESVAETLRDLKVSRIGHGVRAVEDAGLMARLAGENVHLEVNPGSNISLSVFEALADHSITKLREAGVSISVSTDDPPYFDTDMSREYANLNATFGWGEADFRAINRDAMAAAFCDEATRTRIMARFEESADV